LRSRPTRRCSRTGASVAALPLASAAERQYRWADVTLPANPTDDEILRIVEDWVSDLERGDYKAAFSRTAHDPYYCWTPDLIRDVVAGYGSPEPHPSGEVFRVTSRATARGRAHYREIDRQVVPPGAIAAVRHDLPLNGEWSDLTATFRVESRADGAALILEEIHVF